MSQLPQLRRQLVAAAARQYAPAAQPRTGRARRALRLAPALAAIGVAIAVAAVALVVAGHGSRGHRVQTTPPAPARSWGERLRASRRALIDELAPLRRPQTVAERAVARTLNRQAMPFAEFYGTPDRGLVRYATTTPWGARLYLVPVTPWTPRQIQARFGKRARTAPPVEDVVVYSPRDKVNLVLGNAGRVRDGTVGIAGGRPAEPSSNITWGFDLVPDGVAKEELVLPRQPGGRQYGYPIYPSVGRVTVPVHGNIAAYRTPRLLGAGEARLWYGVDGHVIRRFGSLAAARRVVPVHGPAPETAKSRAAERDPSTPNPVTITPTVGGPTTAFRLHFRALLNGAIYGITWSGPRCPGLRFPPGISGRPGTVLLRGDLVSTTLRPSCSGTYRVFVRVTGLNPIGTLRPVGRKISAKPFGSATLTLR